MQYFKEEIEKLVVLPSINPDLISLIGRTYICMNRCRKYKKSLMNPMTEKRRCNRCGLFFNTEETVLRKYYNHSRRRYRLCFNCSEYQEKRYK